MTLLRDTILTGAILFCALFVSNGQPLHVREAENPNGWIMSAEDSQKPELRIPRRDFVWLDDHRFRFKGQDDLFHIWDCTDGTQTYTLKATTTLNDAPGSYYIRSLSSGGIVYGEAVSRNEFAINGGIFPSGDGRIAFYRKDERNVTEYPLVDITSRTGNSNSIRYPMNGMPSEKVSLGVYDPVADRIIYLQINDFTDERYICGVTWSPDFNTIYVQVLDREQHNLKLNAYDSRTGAFRRTLLTEHNDAWVEPYDGLHFIGQSLFVYSTDNRDGYKNLYLCDMYGTVRRIVRTDADIRFTAYADGYLYYTSAELSPVENHLFRVKLLLPSNGKLSSFLPVSGIPKRLTDEEGWHRIIPSPDMKYFLDDWSSFSNPGETLVKSCEGKVLGTVETHANPIGKYVQCEMEMGTVPSADGTTVNYYRLIKPVGFRALRTYPLIVYVYGGPHSQMVNDSWLANIRMWEMAMAQRGYAVYVQDNRGTANRGAAFEKAINRACGQVEMADQMAGLKTILERNPWIDRDRIGVHGWSYGGFMTISLAANYPDVFKAAVAGGPVIDWKWYEVMYGERYMDTEKTNPEGFRKTSLTDRGKDMKCRLLICQGAVDKTVVWQHSLNFVQQCVEDGVQLDYFPYPCSEHNMTGKARFHLYEKITDWFLRNL